MENWIFKYTEFLLASHNCVIIPDLGAFIINNESSELSDEGILIPTYSLIFNQDLKHNDGLLSSFIQQQENISYQTSCKKIKQAVLNIKSLLQKGSEIECLNLGKLSLNENSTILFVANSKYIYPSNWGLQPVYLKRVIDIETEEKNNTKVRANKKYNIGRIASAAALILFFFVPSLDITEHGNNRTSQQASFIHLLPNINEVKDGQTSISENASNNVNTESFINLKGEEDIPQLEEKKIFPRTYYIILGSEKNEFNAQELKNKIQIDFPDVTILKVKNRYRIYSVSFNEKQEAEKYLTKFRNDNPKYKTAWLYSKKNI